MYATIYIGTLYPIELGDTFLGSGLTTWIYIILLYSFIASVLPVWMLLQPRDHINAHELFIGMGLMYLGLLILRPEVVARSELAPRGGSDDLSILVRDNSMWGDIRISQSRVIRNYCQATG